MFEKKIKYIDYNGEEREEVFYFHLNKAEIMEWELSEVGGLRARLEKIIASKDIPEIAAIFKEIIMKSYGVKSPDGKKFIKNKEVLNDFMQTEAYSELYMSLATDTDAASEFINKVIPKIQQAS